MASIDKLNLSDWEAFANRITALIDSGEYDWALDTLEGIRDTVRARQCVTDKQRAAVDNIEEGGERAKEHDRGWERRRPGGSRRYEGFRR